MSSKPQDVEALLAQKYRHGFITDIESDSLPPGLDEDVVAAISKKKHEPQFLLNWRLKAFRHWQTMKEPTWAHVHYKPIDYQDISYYSAPRAPANAPKSLDEVDPKLLATYEKLGIPLHERARLAGVAVDAVFDSVSVATTFKEKLGKAGVIFCSFSDAVRNHPELVALLRRHIHGIAESLVVNRDRQMIHHRHRASRLRYPKQPLVWTINRVVPVAEQAQYAFEHQHQYKEPQHRLQETVLLRLRRICTRTQTSSARAHARKLQSSFAICPGSRCNRVAAGMVREKR